MKYKYVSHYIYTMELCDHYLYEFFLIDPTVNDILQKKEWEYKQHIQPNVYSEPFYENIYQLNKKYKTVINKQQHHTLYDNILLSNIEHNLHMEKGYEIYMYIPIDLHNNILINYVTESTGQGTYQFNNKYDYSCFRKRLRSLTSITHEIIQKMKQGMKHKVVLYSKVVDAMIDQLKDIIQTKSFLHQKKSKYTNTLNEDIETYLEKNLMKLLSFLLIEYETKDTFGLCSYKGGKHAYQTILQNMTFDVLTPQMVHDFGLSELDKLSKEKKRLSQKISINETTYQHETDIIPDLKKIQSKIKKATQTYFPQPYHDYKIKKVPQQNEHMYAYYSHMTSTFYMNTSKPENVKKHELLVLSLHEGNPGHHYQLQYNKGNTHLPEYLQISQSTAYAEGWAFYCENVYPYKDNMEYYYKLNYDINRSLRLVLDTGIHFFGWDYKTCFDISKKYIDNTDSFIHSTLLRYICIPGQAITYKIGGHTMIYLQNKLIDKGYTLQQIHKLILDMGPIPINFLLDALLKYVQ